ncbi:MAG: F0F1 ATP synthase subunit B [Solirubrobacteraceae bacterium]
MAALLPNILLPGSSSFLITPNVGIMIWTLVVFAISLVVLVKAVFPRIAKALDSRVELIDESIDEAARTRKEAEELLASYRERLKEARAQADEIIARARKAGEVHQHEAVEAARAERERLLEQTRRDIAAETSRAIDEIRREVADLTVQATERLTRKSLTSRDHKRLVEDALSELDFSSLSAGAN